jgi:hypothetical protein
MLSYERILPRWIIPVGVLQLLAMVWVILPALGIER